MSDHPEQGGTWRGRGNRGKVHLVDVLVFDKESGLQPTVHGRRSVSQQSPSGATIVQFGFGLREAPHFKGARFLDTGFTEAKFLRFFPAETVGAQGTLGDARLQNGTSCIL